MKHLHAETLKMIRHQLGDRFPDVQVSNPAALDQFAQSLQAIAIEYDVPVIEGLLYWIDDRYEGKDWSLAAWSAWCGRYAELRAKLAQAEMCPRCLKNPMVLTKAGVWWCAECGEVEQ